MRFVEQFVVWLLIAANYIFPRLGSLITRPFLEKKKRKIAQNLGDLSVELDQELLCRLTGLTKSDVKPKLELGPVDRVGGMFNPTNNELTIDILEIFLRFEPETTQEFDDLVTNVVAHESRHAMQKKTWGIWLYFFQAMIVVLPWVYVVFWHPVATFWSTTFFGAILGWVMELFFVRRFIQILIYYLSPHEIDARLFARKAVKNPQWHDVVVVHNTNHHNLSFLHHQLKMRV